MYCQNCGKELSNDVVFCPSCGTKIDSNSGAVIIEEHNNIVDKPVVETVTPKKSKKKMKKRTKVLIVVGCIFILFLLIVANTDEKTLDQLENADFGSNEKSTAVEDAESEKNEKYSDEEIISFFNDCLYKTDVDAKKFRKDVTEERFFHVWCSELSSSIKEKSDFNKSTCNTISDRLEAYKKIWPESTNLNDIYSSLDKLEEYLIQKDDVLGSLGYNPEEAYVTELDFYILKRLETRYDDNFLGELQEVLDDVTADNSSNWLATNVEYFYGEPTSGDDKYVIYSTTLNPFSESGAYTISCVNTGKTMEIIDGKGFVKDVPVYRLIQSDGKYSEYDYFNLLEAFDRELTKICAIEYEAWENLENSDTKVTLENYVAADLVNMTLQELENFFGCEAEFLESDGGSGTFTFANCPDLYFLFVVDDWINMYVDPQKTVSYIYVASDKYIDDNLIANMTYSEIQAAIKNKQYSVSEESGFDELNEMDYFYIRLEKYPYTIRFSWNADSAGTVPADNVVICGISSSL